MQTLYERKQRAVGCQLSMDMSTCYPVFLLLGLLRAVAAHVEAPANVTLHCHNMHNVLKWHYGQFPPGLRFRVDIGSTAGLKGYPNELWVNPGELLQADVSFLHDPSNDYYIAVTAVVGQNESDSAPQDGIEFSYFKDSQADRKCAVDFPPVNVTAQHDGTVLLRFKHPSLVYNQTSASTPNTKRRQKKSHDAEELPVFNYNVIIINQKERHHSSHCMDSVCEKKLSVDAAQKKHCLKIKGELDKILVRPTQDYCVGPLEEKPSYLVHICVVGTLLALSSVAFVLFMVYRKKTQPSSSLPKAMKFSDKLKPWNWGADQDTVLVSEVGAVSPTPLLSTEEAVFTPTFAPSTETDLRLPLGVSTEAVDVSDDVEVGVDEGPGYMQGGDLGDDEELSSTEAPSGYEKRQVVVELAPDEQAEGYRAPTL